MAFPTSRFPTWATDGGADVTDPGTSKQATGWEEAEAPAADHTNWLLNNLGEWIVFLHDAGASHRAFDTIDNQTGTPWDDSTPTGISVQYLAPLNTWYAAVIDDVSGDVWVYQSDDGGVTWGTGTNLVTSGAATISQFATDGTKLGIIVDDVFYRSPSKAITGLVTEGTIGAATDTAGALIYDSTQAVWVAGVNDNTTKGLVYTTPDTVSWTLRHTMTASDDILNIGINAAGYAVLVSDTQVTRYAADTTGTWTAGGTTPGVSANGGYSAGAGIFWAASAADGSLSFSADGTSWADTGFNVELLIDTPRFLFIVDNTAADGVTYAIRNATSGTVLDLNHLGELRRDADADIVSLPTPDGGKQVFEGSSSTMVWSWGSTFKQAESRF